MNNSNKDQCKIIYPEDQTAFDENNPSSNLPPQNIQALYSRLQTAQKKVVVDIIRALLGNTDEPL